MTAFHIRPAQAADTSDIAAMITAAFGTPAEAGLVSQLRETGDLLLELVATEDNAILGHIAFSRMTVVDGDCAVTALAPLAVRPGFQRRGVGSALIRAGLERLAASGEDLVVVVGDPAYYTRHGFDAALGRRIATPWAGDAFMALALRPGSTSHLPIRAAFAAPFSRFE